MRLIATIISLFFLSTTFAQTYNMPGGTVNTCGGNFYDTGGSGSNYGNSQNITTTFCSNAGNCVQVNFSSFNIENGWDFLNIYDGPTTGSTLIGSYTGGTSPGTITSTTGCLTFNFTSDGSVTRPGWAAALSCVACPASADYIMPTIGINSEYVGSCLVSDCGPFTFADDGNLSGNYSNNINQIYRVFCPNTAGNCMQVTFNSFDLANNFDFLLVKNGPTQNSPDFITAPSSPTAYGGITALHSNLNASTPFSYTSTDASGCLTFRNYTSGVTNAAGWDATLQCVPCAGGPNGTDNNDCQTMTPLCSAATITGNATGPGIVAEGCNGTACPAGGENHTNWYTFTAQTSGTIQVMMTPTSATDDYDFAIYGPNVTCGALGAPLRCTDSGNNGSTGLTSTAFDLTEDVTGDSYLQEITAIAGQSFILVVDEWSPTSGGGYDLTFGGTASLDCTILPIELTEFNANYTPEYDVVDLSWITESERDNDRFEVERSIDGVNFEVIRTLKGAGTTQMETQYFTADENPIVGVNYYRLNQFDFDGNSKYSEVRAVNILSDDYDLLSIFPNPTSGKTEVIFNSYSKEEVMLSVFSSDGRKIVNMPLQVLSGGNRFDLDLSNHQKGIYFITITTRDKVYKTKVSKQ